MGPPGQPVCPPGLHLGITTACDESTGRSGQRPPSTPVVTRFDRLNISLGDWLENHSLSEVSSRNPVSGRQYL